MHFESVVSCKIIVWFVFHRFAFLKTVFCIASLIMLPPSLGEVVSITRAEGMCLSTISLPHFLFKYIGVLF